MFLFHHNKFKQMLECLHSWHFSATDVQKFTVTVDIKYQMLILCNDAKVSLLNAAVKAAFSNLEEFWTGLTIDLSVSGSCSKSVKKEVLIKAEFSKLS